MAGAQMHI